MTCPGCTTSPRLDLDISMAFQPIYDSDADRVWGYEALVRGVDGQGAGEVLSQVRPEQRYRFDQQCRVKAVELAALLQGYWFARPAFEALFELRLDR